MIIRCTYCGRAAMGAADMMYRHARFKDIFLHHKCMSSIFFAWGEQGLEKPQLFVELTSQHLREPGSNLVGL